MANSARYRRLTSRIVFLENNLLPPVKLAGNYTKKESDLIRSYVLLTHAEIESYFEDIALAKAQKSLNDWKVSRKRSHCLLAMMSFTSVELNWEKEKVEKKVKFDYRVNRTFVHFKEKLKNNHGIKSNNVLDILLPIGIEEHELDTAWLTIMDEFGKKRGLIAHSTIGVQNQIDLVTEKKNININILPEILNLDLLVKKIK